MNFELSIEADLDLDQIYDYTIANFGIDKAVKYVESFDDIFENLVEDPFLGRDRTDIRPGLRSIVKDYHIVFYRVQKDCIRIVRILRASRDLPNLYFK